jgi:hypothetical protein
MSFITGRANDGVVRGFERLLSVQRPVVLAHIRRIRRSNPDATPAQVVRILERRYLAAITTGGALVGASAALPVIGTTASVALSTAETAGFLEASALFAQSVTEVHGIAVSDPERARILVMTMILGGAGSELVEQLAGEVVGGRSRSVFWGDVVTKNLPGPAVGRIAGTLRTRFLRHFAAREGASILGRAIPFGIGAVIGGAGNHVLGRRVIASSRGAFESLPPQFPLELQAVMSAPTPVAPPSPPYQMYPAGPPPQ